MIKWQCTEVFLHRKPVDFRKSVNGLNAIIEHEIGRDAFSGQVFVFCNKNRDKLKVLYWDKSGFALWYKRGVAKYSGSTPLSMVSAFDVELGLVLYHKAGRGKGNELAMARELIESLDITGAILTLDALHCQVETTIHQIKEQNGIALVQCKKNQPMLLEAVDALFQKCWALPEAEQVSLSESETGHGRKETRSVWSTDLCT